MKRPFRCPKCGEDRLCFGHFKCHSCDWEFTSESLAEARQGENANAETKE